MPEPARGSGTRESFTCRSRRSNDSPGSAPTRESAIQWVAVRPPRPLTRPAQMIGSVGTADVPATSGAGADRTNAADPLSTTSAKQFREQAGHPSNGPSSNVRRTTPFAVAPLCRMAHLAGTCTAAFSCGGNEIDVFTYVMRPDTVHVHSASGGCPCRTSPGPCLTRSAPQMPWNHHAPADGRRRGRPVGKPKPESNRDGHTST